MDRGQFGAQGGYLGPERDKLGRRRKLFDNEGRCGGGLRGPSHLAYGGRGRTPSRLRHGIEAREAERANVGRARFEHHEMDEVTGDCPDTDVANVIGANQDAEARPRTLSHIVYFVPDMDKMANFYIDRLKFVVTDKFNNAGPFLRPQANWDHHCLFMIQTPEYMQGLEHVAFHMQGPTDLMLAGSRMVKKGYESFWGPGRHKFGSNWFWYFNSPLGTHIEYDADMDLHDDEWEARYADIQPETAQMFLFENVEKWTPGGPPPGKK